MLALRGGHPNELQLGEKIDTTLVSELTVSFTLHLTRNMQEANLALTSNL